VPRKLLPIVVIPLDDFGKEVSSVFEETIALAEPSLFTDGWVRIRPVWSEENQLDSIKNIADVLTLTGELGAGHYENATLHYQEAMVIPIGSLSLYKDRTLLSFQALLKSLLTERFSDQVGVLPIFDVSSITGEYNFSFEDSVKDLHKLVNDLEWKDFVYLVDNYSGPSIRSNDRHDIVDAVRLFLEVLTMGDFWGEYTQSWLQKEPASREEQFASFSVFSLASPQTDLIRYLSHVGFYQLLEWAAVENEDKKQIATLELPGEKLISKAAVMDQKPHVVSVLPPNLFEPKITFQDRVQGAIKNFEFQLAGWMGRAKYEIQQARYPFINQAEKQIQDFRQKVTGVVQRAFDTDKFVSNLRDEVEGFQALSNLDENQEASSRRLQLLDEFQVEGILDPVYSRITNVVKRLPNATSLIFHVLIVVGMLYVANQELLKYWPWSISNIRLWFWVGSILFLVLFIYLSWRIPRWRVAKLLRTELKGDQQKILKSIESIYDELQGFLELHWAKKRTRAVQKDLADSSLNIRKCLFHQQSIAEEKQILFPYPEVNWDFVRAQEGVFLKFLEPPTNMDDLLERLHRKPEEFYPSLKNMSKELSVAFLEGDVDRVEKILLNTIRSQFAAVDFVIGEEVVSRMKEAAVGWGGMHEMPLLKVPSVTKKKISDLYCAANKEWKEYLEEAFGKQIDDATIIDLSSKDRIYFFQTHYNISLSDLLDEKKE